MQVQDASLVRHHAGDMRRGGEAQQFIKAGLAGAMVADRNLSDAEECFDEHEVRVHAAGQRRGRHMIAPGVSPGVQALFAQRIDGRQQFARTAGDIIRAEQANDAGHAGGREARQRHGGHAGSKARLAAAAGDVHMAIDQAWNQARTGKINGYGCGAQRRRQLGKFARRAYP